MFTSFGSCLAFLPFGGGVSTGEMVILGAVAVLLFGSKLPDVMRSMGKSLSEFRKGMSGIENEIRAATSLNLNSPPPRRTTTYRDEEDRSDPAVPKFEPPPATTVADATPGDAGPTCDGAPIPRYEPPQYEQSASEPPTG